MHAVAVAMLGPGADVEDVVQDAALVALARLDTVRDPAAAGSWLTGLTRNLCRQALARRSRVRPMAQGWESLVDPGADPATILETHARSDWVWGAVNGLSEPLRQTVVLRYFSRASSYDAIAAVLGVPVGTVRSRLNQARRLLAASLAELAATGPSPEHIRTTRTRAALFTGIYAEYNHGTRCALLRSALTADAELRRAGLPGVERGGDHIADWLEGDIDLGVQVQLHDVIAGERITVVEGSFLNPPDHPDQCPEITTHVYLHDGEGIAVVRLHYADGVPADARDARAPGTG